MLVAVGYTEHIVTHWEEATNYTVSRTPQGESKMNELESEVRDRLMVKRVECKTCGQQPVVGWKNRIHLVCDCGSRVLPGEALLKHEWMPEDVQWTVVENDS